MIQHLYESVSPTMALSVALGLFPFVWKTEKGRKIMKTFILFKIMTLIYITVYTGAVVDLILSPKRKNQIEERISSAVVYIGLLFKLIGHITCTYIIYSFDFLRSKYIKKNFEDVAMVDLMIENMGKTIEYKKHFWFQVLGIISGLFCIVFVISEQYMYIKNENFFSITYSFCIVYYFPLLLIFTMELQFSVLVFLIYNRFTIVNKELIDMARNNELTWKIYSSDKKIAPILSVFATKTNEYTIPHSLRKIEMLMKLHDLLNDIAHRININYHIQILPTLAAQFIITVFSIFYAYYNLTVSKNFIVTLQWTIWVILTCSEILLVTVPCHFATKEATTTGVCIHKILMNKIEPYMIEKLLIFSQQVHQRPLHFTALGLFNIDATLLFTIGGSAATYLLIMLQFQEGSGANCITQFIMKNGTILDE